MTITEITRQQKNSRRWSLSVDGRFVQGIAEETRVQFALVEGLDLEDSDLERILKWDEVFNAKQSAYRFCSQRRKTRREVERKLQQSDYSPKAIAEAIDELEEFDVINDARLVEAWVHDRHLKKSVGPHVLRKELFAKGIDSDVVDQALGRLIPPDRERELIERALRSRSIPTRPDRLQEWFTKTARFLASRGFNNSVIYEVLTDRKEDMESGFTDEQS